MRPVQKRSRGTAWFRVLEGNGEENGNYYIVGLGFRVAWHTGASSGQVCRAMQGADMLVLRKGNGQENGHCTGNGGKDPRAKPKKTLKTFPAKVTTSHWFGVYV